MTIAEITQKLTARSCAQEEISDEILEAAKAIAESDGCQGQKTFPCVPHKPEICVCLQEAIAAERIRNNARIWKGAREHGDA